MYEMEFEDTHTKLGLILAASAGGLKSILEALLTASVNSALIKISNIASYDSSL